LDETGLFLWEAMDRAEDKEELLVLYKEHVSATAEEEAELREVLDNYLNTLKVYGILRPEESVTEVLQKAANKAYLAELAAEGIRPWADLSLAGLTLRLMGREEYFSEEFLPFALPRPPLDEAVSSATANRQHPSEAVPPSTATRGTEACDFSPSQCIAVCSAAPPSAVGARFVLRSEDLEILFDEDRRMWLLLFPRSLSIRLAELSEDGAAGCIYVRNRYSEEALKELRFDVFHALRHMFLYFAQLHGRFALHSASILYRDRAWVFSAPAGTGKSTHARLWGAEYGCPQLNGDLAILSINEEGTVLFHGVPWCGTSGITTTKTLPLGGVILLRRGTENHFDEAVGDRSLLLANRFISPSWTAERLKRNLDFAAEAAAKVPVWRYYCNMEPEAAQVCKARIDAELRDAD
jgi:hypothetical protein